MSPVEKAFANLKALASAAEKNGLDTTAAAYRSAALIFADALAPPVHEGRPGQDLYGSVLRRPVPFPGRNSPETHEIAFIISHGSGPIEVFIHGAPAPYQSVTNAIGRLVSMVLQCGATPERIVKTLRGLSDGDWAVRWSEGVNVRSLPDALARVIEEWNPDSWKPTKEKEDS